MARAAAEGLGRPVGVPVVSRVAVAAAGGVVAVLGLAVAVLFAVVPFHLVVERPVPVQLRTGEFDLTLTATGQTTPVPTPVTCLPAQGYVAPGQEQDPACLSRDRSRDRIALVGLAALVVGGVVWQRSGVERSLPRRP